jgi:hypothetical protein
MHVAVIGTGGIGVALYLALLTDTHMVPVELSFPRKDYQEPEESVQNLLATMESKPWIITSVGILETPLILPELVDSHQKNETTTSFDSCGVSKRVTVTPYKRRIFHPPEVWRPALCAGLFFMDII